MIQSLLNRIAKLKYLLTKEIISNDDFILDNLPGTMDVQDYLETQPDFKDSDLI